MEKAKPMEIINIRTVRPTDFDPEDIDAFIRLINGENPLTKQTVPEWEQELERRIDMIRYWFRIAVTTAVVFTVLGFSIIGMIATVAQIAAG